jgi:hypothetical protein
MLFPLKKGLLIKKKIIKKERNENKIDPYVPPLIVMGF